MDKNDILLKTFQALKEFRESAEQAKLKKLWKEILLPCSIEEALDHLTKDALSEIRQFHDLRNLSALKKNALIAELATTLPRKIQDFMFLMDEGRYLFIQMISQKDGILEVEDLEIDKIENWRKTGFIFSGTVNERKVLFMPREILKAFQTIDQKTLYPIVQRNTEWILLSQGMLYYYGVSGYNQLRNNIRDLTGEEPDFLELHSVLWKAHEFYGEIKPDHYGHWANGEVFDIDKVIREHQARPGVDFVRLSKHKLLKAGQPGYIDKTPAFHRFRDFLLSEYEMTKSEAEKITFECQQVIKYDLGPTSVLEFLETRIEFSSFELQQLVGEVMYLSNHTRQWITKGHTPDELLPEEKKLLSPLPPGLNNTFFPFAAPLTQPARKPQKLESRENVIDLKTRQKIGRNDPCPCCSGKKFKHCCGKG